MVKQTIQIFARVKPSKGKTSPYEVDVDEEGHPRLTISVPKDAADGYVNNRRENFYYRFQKVFDQNASQDEVFDAVAKPVVDNIISGYNGTIFAYGQTGSGKTFTITGGPERYADRGIIPRTLSYLFSQIEETPDRQFTMHISYLEIYNENGYDLLDPKHEVSKLENLPKVSLMEDSDQNIHLKNLSVHQAGTEEEALNLLFMGDTNRMIAETPMNQASTRSHCIFTIHLSSREVGSAVVRRAKLHLVDLAGSERVGKSGVNGLLLSEAKYINLSLHFLEQVITSLADKSRSHIPYRNSMMTSVLRDSLGGNCMTTMIATCSMDKRNVEESISTCRFAQRVALIKNEALLNEDEDPQMVIKRQKQIIQQLRDELAMATGQPRTDELSEDEMHRTEEMIQGFLDDGDQGPLLFSGDSRKILHGFKFIRKLYKERPAASAPPPPAPAADEPLPDIGPYNRADTEKLKELVVQRDNEINILVSMLKKEKQRNAAGGGQGSSGYSSLARSESESGYVQSNGGDAGGRRASSVEGGSWGQEQRKLQQERDARNKQSILGKMSLGRQEAFDLFMRDYPDKPQIEKNKQTLKDHYAEAKSLGQRLNQTKSNINKVKAELEHHRMQNAMSGLSGEDREPDEKERILRHDMEGEKALYKQTFGRLRSLKSEIEHLQHLLEKSKVKVMKDFELWWAEQTAAAQAQAQPQDVRAAWRTPPVTPLDRGLSSGQGSFEGRPPSSNSSVTLPRPPSSARSRNGSFSSSNGRMAAQLPPKPPPADDSAGKVGGITLTGDAQADADIMAFVKARQNLLRRKNMSER